MTLYCYGLSPNNPQPQANHEKKYQTNLNRGASYKIPDQPSLKLSVIKDKQSVKGCHSPKEPDILMSDVSR